MELIWLISGLFFGGLTSWLLLTYSYSNRDRAKNVQIGVLKEKEVGWHQEIAGLQKKLDLERQKVVDLNISLSGTEADYRNLQEKLLEQKSEIEGLREKFSLEFKVLANEIFEEKTQKFTSQNQSNLTQLLHPLSEKIEAFEKKVESTNKESIERNSALREQIKGLRELNQQITKEASNLTKALKGESKVQGNWGEIILEGILEKSGLSKGREYSMQTSFTNEEGRRLQPDVIIKLPDSKNIIIDSKVVLTAYERYVNSMEEEERQSHMKAHMQAVRRHIKGLGSKNYQDIYRLKGLDFVLMFIPVEPAFTAATQYDPELFNEAYEKNIVIVSPSTLIATLRTISNLWKNEYQNRNALEIARQGGELYDKFVGFTNDLLKIGKSLDHSQNVYRDAMKKLHEGKGNLVNRAHKIKELGAKTNKQIEPKLIGKPYESQ